MDTLFHLNTQEENEEGYETKMNLDELYQKKQQRDMNTINCYNKILNRIHTRIRTTSMQQNVENQFCWFIVPEMIIGVPMFDHGACTAYLIDKLRDNGFIVRYTHPNLLFISWKHWVPAYVRSEIKKKTGVVVDGYGNQVNTNSDKNDENKANPFANMRNSNSSSSAATKTEKDNQYRNIDSYRPSGGLIYNNEILKKIETKLNRE